jgi:hypothetical protein
MPATTSLGLVALLGYKGFPRVYSVIRVRGYLGVSNVIRVTRGYLGG